MSADVLDLDRLREAHRPWSFRAAGRVYVARPVSVEQVVRYDADTRGASQPVVMAARRRLLRLAFPWRPSFIWRGDPVRLICAVSPALHAEIWSSFCASLQSLSRGHERNGIDGSKSS